MTEKQNALDMTLDDVIAKTTTKGPRSQSDTHPSGSKATQRVKKHEKSKRPLSGGRYNSRRNEAEDASPRRPFPARKRTPWDVSPSYGSPGPRKSVDARLIRVSGLEFSVLQEDLVELFEAVGPLQKCWIDYDRTDRSLGTGAVIFEDPADAERAVTLFNGKSLDGSVISLTIQNSGRRRVDFPRRNRSS